jgi:uracil-DNA glycosylase
MSCSNPGQPQFWERFKYRAKRLRAMPFDTPTAPIEKFSKQSYAGPVNQTLDKLTAEIKACRICRARFAATATGHAPRPVVWFGHASRIVIAGQAPGMRVHASGRPFADPSGDRLRDWLGLSGDAFYDRKHVSIVSMAFCFPGYDAKGADLPPPPICAKTWRVRVFDQLGDIPLTILVGGYAQKWHLTRPGSVTDTVRRWRDFAPRVYPLPHPSWRNTGWLKRNPWFEVELLPELKARVREVLDK